MTVARTLRPGTIFPEIRQKFNLSICVGCQTVSENSDFTTRGLLGTPSNRCWSAGRHRCPVLHHRRRLPIAVEFGHFRRRTSKRPEERWRLRLVKSN